MLSIVLALLLDSIVGQMNEIIIELSHIHVVGPTWSAEVALFEEVNVQVVA